MVTRVRKTPGGRQAFLRRVAGRNASKGGRPSLRVEGARHRSSIVEVGGDAERVAEASHSAPAIARGERRSRLRCRADRFRRCRPDQVDARTWPAPARNRAHPRERSPLRRAAETRAPGRHGARERRTRRRAHEGVQRRDPQVTSAAEARASWPRRARHRASVVRGPDWSRLRADGGWSWRGWLRRHDR